MVLKRLETSRPFFSFFYHRFVLRPHSLLFRLAAFFLLPLSFCYLFVITLKRLLRRPYDAGIPVVSVGNITAGGTGKTTLVKYLAGRLSQRFEKVAVLAYGTNRNPRSYRSGQAGPPENFGDEVRLLGRSLPGVFLVQGRNKLKSLKFAAARARPQAVIIDDGFHCHGIKKSLEFLLLDASNPFDNGWLVPAGLLREPASSLRRADVFVITQVHLADVPEQEKLAARLKQFGKPVFVLDYRVDGLFGPGKELLPADQVQGKKLVAFTGIGNPFSFFRLLTGLNPGKVTGVIYPDHFSYTGFDLGQIRGLFLEEQADLLVTTEKDFVKIQDGFAGLPFYFLGITGLIREDRELFDKCLFSIL